jgi:hypothetical protein
VLGAFALDVALVLWLRALDAGGMRRLLPVVFLALLWGWVELAQAPGDARRRPILDWHRNVFAVVAFVLALRMGARLALELGVMDGDWAPVVRRGFGVLGGVLLAVWGNALPKLLSPWGYDEQPFDWQGVHRFVGWLAALSGIGVAVAWVVLPVALAVRISTALFLTFAILAVGRKLASVAGRSQDRPSVS